MSRRSAPAWLWAASLAAGLGITGLRHLPDDPPSARSRTPSSTALPIREPRPAPESVLIVAIDDASLDAIGLMAPMREALATAIERLEAAGAGCIVVDMLLVEPTSADARLARVLSSSPSAVLAVAAVPGVVEPVPPPIEMALKNSAFPVVVDLGTRPWSAWRLQMPTTPLALAARTLGHVNIALSADRVARRVPLAVQVADGVLLPSAALIAAHRLRGDAPGELRLERGRSVQLGDVRVPTDQAGQVLLDLYGGPRTLATVSLDALLAGEVAPDRLKGGPFSSARVLRPWATPSRHPLPPTWPASRSSAPWRPTSSTTISSQRAGPSGPGRPWPCWHSPRWPDWPSRSPPHPFSGPPRPSASGSSLSPPCSWRSTPGMRSMRRR